MDKGEINTLRPRQNCRHFADDIFKSIFLNENVWISLKIWLKFVPKVPINNIPAMVQIMAWRRSGYKPLSEPMMISLLTHICVTRPQWVNWSKTTTKHTNVWTKVHNSWFLLCMIFPGQNKSWASDFFNVTFWLISIHIYLHLQSFLHMKHQRLLGFIPMKYENIPILQSQRHVCCGPGNIRALSHHEHKVVMKLFILLMGNTILVKLHTHSVLSKVFQWPRWLSQA